MERIRTVSLLERDDSQISHNGPEASVPSLLYAGRYEPHKNLDRLLDAFEGSDWQRDGGTLTLIGDDPAKVTKNRPNGVSVLGFIPKDDLHTALEKATATILVSLEEGLGLGNPESKRRGKPIITSNRLPMSFWATESDSLVDPEDTSDIRAGIDSMLGRYKLHSSDSIREGFKQKMLEFNYPSPGLEILTIVKNIANEI
jgi:glycosyltransferase involved in cell wall biosynthesis